MSSIVARRPILSPPPSLPLFNLEPENNRSFRDRNKKRRRASSLSPSFRCNRFRNEREKERLENKRTDQKVEIYSTWRSVSRRPRLASTNRFVSGRAINGVHARTERASDRSIERAGLNRALVSYKFSPSSIFIRPFSRNRFVSRDAERFLSSPLLDRTSEGRRKIGREMLKNILPSRWPVNLTASPNGQWNEWSSRGIILESFVSPWPGNRKRKFVVYEQ